MPLHTSIQDIWWRTKASNAVTLVQTAGEVTETYFKSRILKKPMLLIAYWKGYLKRLQLALARQEMTAFAYHSNKNGVVQAVESRGYLLLPSWEVRSILQAPGPGSQKHCGGLFPNYPALTAEVRHDLGLLVRSNKCPAYATSGHLVTMKLRQSNLKMQFLCQGFSTESLRAVSVRTLPKPWNCEVPKQSEEAVSLPRF